MNKKVLFRLGLAAIGVLVAVLWLVAEVGGKYIFDLATAIAIFSGLGGVMYILKGCLGKNSVTIKKFSIFFGASLLVVCVISIAGAIALPGQYILPIVAIILTAAIFIGILFTGGKKWNQADNENVGYKDYHQRKLDEMNKKNDGNNTDKE